MRIRLTWRGETAAVHPAIPGDLRPGETLDVELPRELVESLEHDTSGSYDIQRVASDAEGEEG
jgi:hypothetical protein